jgi:sugar phosphate isomerase/epimerase
MQIHLCNEVVRDLDFAGQCRFAREAGYDGLEIAPFTLSPEPHRLDRATTRELRSIADGEGTAVAGLHWLLSAPEGLSITDADTAVAARTTEVGRRLVALCAELGGSYLVHGSPRQRLLEKGREEEGRQRAAAYFAAMAEAAREAGVVYLLEPLGPTDGTGLIRTVEDAVAIMGEIGSPALKTMLDCYATGDTKDIIAALARWVPHGVIHHLHFNDANQRGPGEGTLDFPAILDTLRRLNYAGTSAVEPFVYRPDGPSCAARSIGYLRGVIAAQAG